MLLSIPPTDDELLVYSAFTYQPFPCRSLVPHAATQPWHDSAHSYTRGRGLAGEGGRASLALVSWGVGLRAGFGVCCVRCSAASFQGIVSCHSDSSPWPQTVSMQVIARQNLPNDAVACTHGVQGHAGPEQKPTNSDPCINAKTKSNKSVQQVRNGN
jgi:hypothetical protein